MLRKHVLGRLKNKSTRRTIRATNLDEFKNFSNVTIDDPVNSFDENVLSKDADYGIWVLLEGDWYSYKEQNAYRTKDKKQNLSSGIHTTIMPSPGTTQNQIPGKFSFDCEEYIEKLTFSLVPGGVRNRGGASEQFCGAVKYEQTIKSVNKNKEIIYNPIHEENGMYLWLSNIYNHAATRESIDQDQGIHYKYDDNGNIINRHDETIYENNQIIPAKELKPGAGKTGPYFIPDYSLSRSGVIPHGSTITLLGDLKSKNGNYVIAGKPDFIDKSQPGNGTWDYNHFSVSPTMGGGTSPLLPNRPFDLDNPPLPFTPIKDLNDTNDKGENIVYTQRIFLHDLYPYSVRPDLRLRDAIKNQQIKQHMHIHMSSKNQTGAQGGILNIPFVNRFVPTVEMNMNMWIEEVEENGETFLQLQYEQIVLFEFGFGDGGGTTSWPHIQVNTLRQYKNLTRDQQQVIDEQFNNTKKKLV